MSRAALKDRPQEEPAPTRASGRSRKDRIAVIDIGSNSIRLVVFEGRSRVPRPFFNEKVICGLGRELNTTGRLSDEGVELALVNLTRFSRMAEGMGVGDITLLATAASREASNGAEFIGEVESRTGLKVQLLSGEEEARVSAMGVIAGIPDADGVMGDLGGGSLELVELNRGQIGSSVTLPLGPLRLMELEKSGRQTMLGEIDERLNAVPWLADGEGRSFYAVGGAWRALARIMMEQMKYPLHVIHGFTVPRREVNEMMRVLSRLGSSSLDLMPSISRRRLESVPYASELLRRVLRVGRPSQIVWSSYGLREGFVFEQLPEKERAKDPLLTTAQELGKEGRFPNFAKDILRWTDGLFPDDDEGWRRLRTAACHLSDLCWREHPDYRARQALWRIMHFPFAGVDHAERAYLACAVFIRYGGAAKEDVAENAMTLLLAKAKRRSRMLGLAMRLAYTLSAGVSGLLERTALRLDGNELRLLLPDDGTVPSGEAVERRFDALVAAADVESGFIDWR